MKIATIVGTRPELIRLSRIIPKLDGFAKFKCYNLQHVLIHTGQNYDKNLKDIFFQELGLRDPDYYINSKADSFGDQIGIIFKEIEKILVKEKPDKVLILGDTNTSCAAFIAARLGIPIFHMEAGNRCWITGSIFNGKDRSSAMPEECNRKMIDHISTYNLPYTPSSKQNLLNEGLRLNNIFETGNPLYEVLDYYKEKIDLSDILDKLKLDTIYKTYYCVTTLHRAELVDNDERLNSVAKALLDIANHIPIIFSCHPRTKNRLTKFGVSLDHKNIKIMEPLGFFDFVKLEKNARIILTDSGSVIEEACMLRIPSISIRDSTERPEIKEAGANIVSGYKTENILRCFNVMLESKGEWKIPTGYDIKDVSNRVINYIIGNQFE
jgi:UDP-N-acetylglucosamine 2-epimerase (non-hydrolysing)